LATKYVTGGDLLRYINQNGANGLSEDTIRSIVSQIAKGLNDMHKQGIVHRDVKHLNIFVRMPEA
jgi:serine/threonine protein kinase